MNYEEIDRCCDQFERRLKSGEAISVEDFLRELGQPNDDRVNTDLRRLERDYQSPVNAPTGIIQRDAPGIEVAEPRVLTRSQIERLGTSQEASFTLGNYQILGKLGQGGMGVVLKGMHRRMTYTPNADYNGSDSFTFTVTDDGSAGGAAKTSSEATVNLSISAVNDTPVANAQSSSTDEDVAKSLTLNGSDRDPEVNQSLTFAIVASPLHGTLTGFNAATGAVTYTPDTDFNGVDSFAFTVSDDSTAGGTAKLSAAATYSLTVNAVNDAPTASTQSATTIEDTSTTLTLAGADNDTEVTQTLTFAIAVSPVHGTLSGFDASAGNVIYTPDPDYNGSDSFSFTVTDDGAAGGSAKTSTAATVSLTITAVNDTPIANPLSASFNEDTAKSLTLIATDGDLEIAQTLTFTIASNPAHGTLTGFNPATGAVTYTPDSDYNGSDSFTFTVRDDGTAGGSAKTSAVATVSLTVNPVNDTPLATAQSMSTDEDVANSLTLTGSDSDPELTQTLSFTIVANPLHGTLSGFDSTTGSVIYTPSTDYNGTDSFTFTVTDDGTGGGVAKTSTTQTISLTINAVNDAPVANTLSATLDEDTVRLLTLAGMDSDPEVTQSLTFAIVSNPAHGTLSDFNSATGTVKYTPNGNYNGSDSFMVSVTDDASAGGNAKTSEPATFHLNVTTVNDAPSFVKGNDVTVNEDSGAQTVANWATSISRGPANEANQSVNFVLSTNNGSLFSSLPAVAADGTLTFTPAANANGATTVSIRLRDDGGTDNNGSDSSATQSFVISVTPINDAPTFALAGSPTTVNEDAGLQTVTNFATSISVRPANESAQRIAAVSVSPTASTGGLTFTTLPSIDATTGTLTYQAAPHSNGSATFEVTMIDDGGTDNSGRNTSDPLSFTISVTAVNDRPTANAQSQSFDEDQVTVLTLSGEDADPEVTQSLTFAIVTRPTHGTLGNIDPVTHQVSYTPAKDYNGPDSFTFTVTDDDQAGSPPSLTSVPVTVNLTLRPVNDPPTLAHPMTNPAPINAGDLFSQQLPADMFADVDGDTLTVSVFGRPSWLNYDAATRTLSGTPANRDAGTVTLTILAKDLASAAENDTSHVASQSVQLTVVPADVVVDSLTANGDRTLTLVYRVLNNAITGAMTLRLIRSADAIADNTGDVTLSTVTLTAADDLSESVSGSSHSKSFTIGTNVSLPGSPTTPGSAAADKLTDLTSEDYFILAVLTPTDTVANPDPNTANNSTSFVGAYSPAGATATTTRTVFVHGGSSDDAVVISYPTATSGIIGLTVNGVSTGNPYAFSSTAQFRIRTHGGNDSLNVLNPNKLVAKPILAHGGDGNDLLSSENVSDAINNTSGADTLFGGAGDDVLRGGLGNDTLDGGADNNTLNEFGNVNFTLTNASLIGLGTDVLTRLQVANLTGGASANTFTAGG